MLRGLVHLRHGFAHLGHAAGLLGAGRVDLAHQVGHAANALHHLGHGLARLVGHGAALLHALHTGADELLDLFGGLGAAPGQGPHLAGHHGKTPALLAGTRGFHSGVQRQDVGLKSNAINHANDVGNAL